MFRLMLPLLLMLCMACHSNEGSKKDSASNLVKTAAGLVSGQVNATGDIISFKGIPFAAPPVGELRWKEPQPVQPWKGVKECNAFGPSPMQPKPAAFSMWSEEFLIPKEPISEDCLYLNVWTGAIGAAEKKPVFVWIYGGGFASGGSGVPIYDGEAMAKKGIVFVSINYRVGVFGFFSHPALSRESGRNASGNYGLMDQVAALKWIKQNIEAFGGDPGNVTIAGQSAGAMSVHWLVASPTAKGLFNKAIAESGANFTRPLMDLQQAESEGRKFAAGITGDETGDHLEKLRRIDAEELMQKSQGFRSAVMDGYVLPKPVPEIFREGKQNKVTLLTGWNQDEGLIFGPIRNATDYSADTRKQYGEALLKYYPSGTDERARQSQLDLWRDIIFGAQNYAWANIESSQGKKVYVYRFTRKVPATGEYKKYGAFHTGEVPYALDNLRFVNRPWEDSDKQLAEIMSGYWANFVKKGDPNGEGLPVWKVYEPSGKMIMILDEEPHTIPIPDANALDQLLKYLHFEY